MPYRPLPDPQRARRDTILAKLSSCIILATDEMLRACGVPTDDPELTVGDLSVDAFLIAAQDCEAEYWHCPDTFCAWSDAELAEFILVRAAYAIDREIDRTMAQRIAAHGESIRPIWAKGRRSAARISGFSLIDAL